jgi:hypothetical protein
MKKSSIKNKNNANTKNNQKINNKQQEGGSIMNMVSKAASKFGPPGTGSMLNLAQDKFNQVKNNPAFQNALSSVSSQISNTSAVPIVGAAAATASDSTPSASGPKMPKGMNEAFVTMYKLLATLSVLMFVVMFFIGLGDFILYLSNESGQFFKKVKDPNMFIKDTTDYDSIKYITTIDDEPYSIFLEETIVGYVYRFFGIFVILLAVQYGIFFWFHVIFKIKTIAI